MTEKLEVRFAQAVVSLQSAAPLAFDQLMALLTERLDDITERLVSSPPERLVQNQGRALEARDLFKELHGARRLMDELKQKGKV